MKQKHDTQSDTVSGITTSEAPWGKLFSGAPTFLGPQVCHNYNCLSPPNPREPKPSRWPRPKKSHI